jgi:glycine/D-amino acid oxidase-like deaminating enzyme
VAGKSCAVIGGGVMGLSTARLLLRQGADVCLYTDALPPTTTSNVAGAQCWPVSVYDSNRRTEAFGAQFVEAANFSFRYFHDLVGPRWGVRWVPNYYLSNHEPLNGWLGGPSGVLHNMQIGFRDFGPGEHIFPTRYARRFHTMLIEPAIYLDTLLQEIIGAGARIEIRRFQQADEVLQLPHTLLFNCTGLGARALFGDEELVPIKGQLSLLLPQPAVDYNIITDVLYMFPRSSGIVLGGSYERGNWDLSTDAGVQDRVIRGHQAIFNGMRERQQQAAS